MIPVFEPFLKCIHFGVHFNWEGLTLNYKRSLILADLPESFLM